MVLGNMVEVILLAAVVGFSIFLTLPIPFMKGIDQRKAEVLNGVAIGVLIYLLMDVFTGTYSVIGEGNVELQGILLDGIIVSYLGFHFLSTSRPRPIGGEQQPSAVEVASLIAVGIGLQNLTEGLALGGSFKLGLSSVVVPLVVGSTIQNVTEGFPISAPFLALRSRPSVRTIGALYLIGGAPTLLGAILSYTLASTAMVVLFNAVALGSIIYVTMEMYKGSVRRAQRTNTILNLMAMGVAAGFALAFLVNLLP
jgi:ZIP family zinc transporter